jgi:uncharacterized protein
MSNRLGAATSPYLLQHADNPVDWWEWSPEAFAEAAERDLPVLLSVGYASCHWCHVMAHESFEDEATAELMNRWFVNVKVDREERPDVDRIYMDAVQAMTGRGGWPMTVILTPDGKPFFAGTYFPKTDGHGHPSFTRVLEAVHDAWISKRAEIDEQAGSLVTALAVSPPPADELPDDVAMEDAYRAIRASYEPRFGGFGGAPKFPQVPMLEFLLRSVGKPWAPEAEEMVSTTLLRMADGGIHDIVGGGFSRYSVDDRWLVPHFEKMLYDNAQLARLYARAHQVTGVRRFAEVARSTISYMLTDLLLADGGFASGEDADSEGVEGKYYVYSWDEIVATGASAAAGEVLGATTSGNFEGDNIVHGARSVDEVAATLDLSPSALQAEVHGTIAALRELRTGRIRPGLDDKAVCAWNAMAIRALAEAGVALHEPDYIAAAARTAEFVLDQMRDESGRLMRSWREGRTSNPAFCDDYGALAVGLFSLYQATGDPRWFAEARDITVSMIDLFWDAADGGFFATGNDAESLIARPKNYFDNPTPADNSLAAEALQHLVAYTGDAEYAHLFDQVLLSGATLFHRAPGGVGHMLAVALTALGTPIELAIVGEESVRAPLVAAATSAFRPGVFLAMGDGTADHGIPLLADRPVGDGAAAYVCRGFVCEMPVATPDALLVSLGESQHST